VRAARIQFSIRCEGDFPSRNALTKDGGVSKVTSFSAAYEGFPGATMVLTGAEIVIRCLQEEKVEYVFGYPGGSVLFIYDELFKQDKVRHVLVRHEQGAVHAADGYARSTERVGVALVTSGPGATNTITGIATAYMDSIPMVVIAGQVMTAT
jgi:glyoxylate carboligase